MSQNEKTRDTIIRSKQGDEVDVVTDSATKNRLCVDATGQTIEVQVTNDESPTKYQIQSDFDTVGDTVGTSADVELFAYVGDGILDFISMTANNAYLIFILIIDGTERIRINSVQLGADLNLTGDQSPIWTDTANKNIRFYPRASLGFKTGFSIKARSTTGNITVKHICMYREKID